MKDKFRLCKYRYYFKIHKPFVFKDNIYFEKVFELKDDEDFYYFYVYNFNKNIYNDKTINFEVQKLNKGQIIEFIKKYLITFIGLLLFISVLFIINKNITEIRFSNNDYYDQEVYEYVFQKLDGTRFKFISQNQINKINKEIRSVFYKYQWISIRKEGTIIYIDIAKTDDDKLIDESKVPGGLYSEYDAIIKGYVIKKGTSLIKKDMSVSKGDELISGIITLYNNNVEFIHPHGYVIGEVTEYITIKVEKVHEDLIRTGNVITKNKIILFNKSKEEEFDQFENYETEKKSKFKLGNFLEIIELKIYELKEVHTEYSLEDAYDYAKSEIINEFNENKEYDNEMIKQIELINGYLKNDIYYVTYLVQSEKEISYFKEYINNIRE